MNITETVKTLKEGKVVAFNYTDPRSYFKMGHGDVVFMLSPTGPITAHVETVQSLEQFERQYGPMEFQAYEEN